MCLFAEALKLRHEADRCCGVACTTLFAAAWRYETDSHQDADYSYEAKPCLSRADNARPWSCRGDARAAFT